MPEPTRSRPRRWLPIAVGVALLAPAPPSIAQDPPRAGPSASATLRPGDTGPAVEGLQRLLNSRLAPSPELDVDGDFGDATRAAVLGFQRSRKLDPTGVADPATREALGPEPAGAASVPSPAEVNARKPDRKPADAADGPPFTSAAAWAVADGKTGETLWGCSENRPLEPASTTKMMTALVVLRLARAHPGALDETIIFSGTADRTVGSTAGIREGERVSARELLYGLLLPSGNDAARAFAEHFGGRLAPAADAPADAEIAARFVAEMNRVAAELGLRETHFANPHGLPAPGHRSSARDLARLASAALADPTFAAVVATPRRGASIADAAGRSRDVLWTNTNKLLEFEGYEGVKTGTTAAAGACLVAIGRRGEDRLIVVVLGASSSAGRYADARNLFRWAWLQRRNPGP